MKVLAGSLLIALLPLAAFAQAADEKAAPDLEIVKFEISVKRAANLEESPVPRADPGSIAQRHADFNVSGPPEDSMGIGATSPRGGTNSSGKKTDRPPTDTTTPRYDRTGQITQSSDAYWPTDKEDNKSPYNFYATLTLKNAGAKAIKNIRWDYVLTDPANKKEIARHNFRAKKALKPGESVTVTEMVKPSGAKRSVEIMRIEYADGSTWQRP